MTMCFDTGYKLSELISAASAADLAAAGLTWHMKLGMTRWKRLAL